MKNLILIAVFLPMRLCAQTINTVAGTGVQVYSGDGGPAISAGISAPVGVAADGSGSYYIVDGGSCVVRRVNSAGIISDFAGHSSCLADPGGTLSGDGGQASAARLNNPKGVAADNTGKLYIADEGNGRVRMVNATGIIFTVAGTGATSGPAGDGGPATAARIDPVDVATDVAGNLYISDNLQSGIRKVDATTGIITTIAGTGTAGYSGDNGPATAAMLTPAGITLDIHGNIYVVNGGNRIRRIDAVTGIITTIAGSGATGSGGDGGSATAASFNGAVDIAADATGNIYIADKGNQVIRKISATGIISAYAGTYSGGYSGDGGPANAARLYDPMAVAIDNNGLLIADLSNQRVRKVWNVSASINVVPTTSPFIVYPNPASAILTIESVTEKIGEVYILDITHRQVFSAEYNANVIRADIRDLPAGVYLIRVNRTSMMKFVKN